MQVSREAAGIYSQQSVTELMHHLPGVLPVPLYKYQAQRLVRELSKVQTLAHLIPCPQPGEPDGRN